MTSGLSRSYQINSRILFVNYLYWRSLDFCFWVTKNEDRVGKHKNPGWLDSQQNLKFWGSKLAPGFLQTAQEFAKEYYLKEKKHSKTGHWVRKEYWIHCTSAWTIHIWSWTISLHFFIWVWYLLAYSPLLAFLFTHWTFRCWKDFLYLYSTFC